VGALLSSNLTFLTSLNKLPFYASFELDISKRLGKMA